MPRSPYARLPSAKWKKKTEELIAAHPLDMTELVDVVHTCWSSIFASRIGTKGFRIGEQIFPKPQIMGFLLHELIPLELTARYPDVWQMDRSGREKDLVYMPDDSFSVEIKTSSHPTQIFGNRSYAQPTPATKKAKAGYYLTINFQKFRAEPAVPPLTRIAFGWLDHTDWIGQSAATGQQARLRPEVYGKKLIPLFTLQ